MKYSTGEDVRVGDVVETAQGEGIVEELLPESGSVSVAKQGGWWMKSLKLLRRAPTPTHYASGEEVRIGDVVLTNADGKTAIIERIDATGLSGRYSGSNDAWTARDAGGVRLMRRGATPEAKPIKTLGDLFRAAPEERAAWVAGKESEPIESRKPVPGTHGTDLGLSAAARDGLNLAPKPDPYAHTAEREEEIYARQILQDAFGSDYTVGVYRLLDGAVKDEGLPAKLRAAIACVRWGGPSAERTAAEILNPKAKR